MIEKHPPLGFVDELIHHIDSGGRLFRLYAVERESCFQWVKTPNLVSKLVSLPKFSLPTLGHFYRPIEDLKEYKPETFKMYCEKFEIEAVKAPPYSEFLLEFSGLDPRTDLNKIDEAEIDKYILLCKAINDSEDNACGVTITAFYHNNKHLPVMDWTLPEGWLMQGIPVGIFAEEEFIPHPTGVGYAVPCRVYGEMFGSLELQKKITGTMWPEIRALLQFLVVINVKKGLVKYVEKSKPRKAMTIKGRRLGYEYHVLDIDPEYVVPRTESMGGHHASPRFHLRRAHLRHIEEHVGHDGRKWKAQTVFVKQTTVGDPLRGVVEKDYNVKGEE